MEGSEYETLRWPTNLDRAAIEARLVKVAAYARANNLPDLVSLFTDVHGMSSAQMGINVVAALTWLQDKPQHRAIATQLEMVAMNLKNLAAKK